MTDLAENITKAVLDVLKRGGDNYNIYVAVKAALAAAPGREKPDPDWVAWLKPATDLYGPKDQT